MVGKGVVITIAAVIVIVILIAVGVYSVVKPPVEELRIGYQPSTHQIAEMTAMEKGWWQRDLAKFGIEKVTDSEFIGGATEMHAMLAGELDVAYVGATPPLSAIDKGLDARIVACVQINGSSLVLRPDLARNYTGPEDLNGLKIGIIPHTSIQEAVLSKWLIDNGLDPEKDVELKSMGGGDAVTVMGAGELDGAFLHEPFPSTIELEGSGKVVVRSGEMWPNHACCCLLVSGELIREHPEMVKQIIRTHINATEYNIAHPDEAAEIYARKCEWDVDKVRYSLENWDGSWIHDPHIMLNCTLEYAKFHYDLGYTDKLLTKEDLFDTRFYDEIMAKSLK
jgi:NitT/TauT family transport system substrate-binding protein